MNSYFIPEIFHSHFYFLILPTYILYYLSSLPRGLLFSRSVQDHPSLPAIFPVFSSFRLELHYIQIFRKQYYFHTDQSINRKGFPFPYPYLKGRFVQETILHRNHPYWNNYIYHMFYQNTLYIYIFHFLHTLQVHMMYDN